jgi:hypothetical protein
MNKNINDLLHKSLHISDTPDANLLRNVKNNAPQAKTSRTTRTLRTVLTAAALVALLSTTAFALNGGLRIFEEKVPERSDLIWTGQRGTDYQIIFNELDEIRDLFTINIGNEYMENGSGNLFVVYPTDADAYASIEFSFNLYDLYCAAWVRLSLDPDVPVVPYDGWYGSGSIDADAEGAEMFTYKSQSNRIEAEIMHNGGMMEMRFFFEGAYYYIHAVRNASHLDAELISAKFIDAFW